MKNLFKRAFARAAVIEYNLLWGPERAVTVPYREDFRLSEPDYAGDSLAAMVRLGRQKGYRFVGCNRLGFNAFFVRESLCEGVLPEASLEACLDVPNASRQRERRLALLESREWLEV